MSDNPYGRYLVCWVCRAVVWGVWSSRDKVHILVAHGPKGNRCPGTKQPHAV